MLGPEVKGVDPARSTMNEGIGQGAGRSAVAADDE